MQRKPGGKVSQNLLCPPEKIRENGKNCERTVNSLVSDPAEEYNGAAPGGTARSGKERVLMSEHKSKVNSVLLILFRILFTFFAIATTCFIFYNSLEIGLASSERAKEVARILNEYLSRAGLEPLSYYAIRKLAHFAEFTLLGFWWTLCLRVYTRRYIRHISWPLLLVNFTACCDETIQTYVIDRSGNIRDVWIDFAGGCTGIFAGLCVIVLLTGFWSLLGFGHKKLSGE